MFGLKFVIKFESIIQKLYWVWEQPSLLFSREFEDLGYLEKLILVLFHREHMFCYSIANIEEKSDIYEYRQNQYPIIFLFNNYYDRQYFKFDNLNSLVKQNKFFKSSDFFIKHNLILSFFLKKSSLKNKSNHLIMFLSIQKILISLYYNSIAYKDFYWFDKNNFMYYNFWILYALKECKNGLYFYDLNYYQEWYDYAFNKKIKRKKIKIYFSLWNLKMKKKLVRKKVFSFFKNLVFYHLQYNLNKLWLSIRFNPSKALRKAVSFKHKIKIKPIFKKYFSVIYPIRFKDSSNVKNINYKNIENYSFFYIRKNRIFNKGRYSRNRQLYRTGVYWCLWLNVIVVYGLYFLFYRFSFNFGYMWLGMFFLILSTIFSRMLKYNFYNIFYIYSELIEFKNWISILGRELLLLFQNFFYDLFSKYSITNLIFKKKKIIFEKNNENYYTVYFLDKIDYIFKLFWKSKRIYIWEYMGEDHSLFKYRTVLHWIKQIYRSITF